MYDAVFHPCLHSPLIYVDKQRAPLLTYKSHAAALNKQSAAVLENLLEPFHPKVQSLAQQPLPHSGSLQNQIHRRDCRLWRLRLRGRLPACVASWWLSRSESLRALRSLETACDCTARVGDCFHCAPVPGKIRLPLQIRTAAGTRRQARALYNVINKRLKASLYIMLNGVVDCYITQCNPLPGLSQL